MDHTKNINNVQNPHIVKKFNKNVPKEFAHYVTCNHTSFLLLQVLSVKIIFINIL